MNEKLRRQRKPFPWRCSACRMKEVDLRTVSYRAKVNHDGRVYELEITEFEVPQCQSCGEMIFDTLTDEQINHALREHLGLLTPVQIRVAIRKLGMQQKEVASALGIAEATLSRWLSGGLIQSRAMDNMLRVYFGIPAVRQVLQDVKRDAAFGSVAVL